MEKHHMRTKSRMGNGGQVRNAGAARGEIGGERKLGFEGIVSKRLGSP
jgi:hypothetical protein